MASHSPEALELAIVTFKSSSATESPPTLPPDFLQACATLQAVPGVIAIHVGRLVEHPDRWAWAARWASEPALEAFLASPNFPRWVASFREPLASWQVSRSVIRGNVGAALGAPCSEIFNILDVTSDFIDKRCKVFVDNVDKSNLPGHHATAYGAFRSLSCSSNVEPRMGTTAIGIMGWDSQEAHLAERGEGKVIDNNVHLVIAGQTFEVYHVHLKKI